MLKLRRIKTLLVTIAVALMAISAPLSAYAKGWTPVKTERHDLKSVGKESDVEVKAARGLIHINTGKTVTVKLYTILGQVVATETLGPGSYQMAMSAHGIYIVKVGDTLTVKVAV